MRAVNLNLIFGLVFIAISASPAFACSCFYPVEPDATEADYREYAIKEFSKAEIVVIGVINAVSPKLARCENPNWNLSSHFNPSGLATIKVETVLKGETPGAVTVKTGGKVTLGENCETTVTHNSCDIDWNNGEHAIWVLKSLSDGGYEFASKCSMSIIRSFISNDSNLPREND